MRPSRDRWVPARTPEAYDGPPSSALDTMVRLPALSTALLVVLLASAAATEPAVAGTPESPDSSVSSACVAWSTAAADHRTAGNVSLSTLTAPGAAFARLQNASALAAARERGALTVVQQDESSLAWAERYVAQNDTIVHRLDLNGSATGLFDRLAAQDGRTPTANFTSLVRSDPAVSMEYLGPTSCRPELNLTATADRGGFRVVPDASNGSLFLVLDQARMAMELGGPPFVDQLELGRHRFELSFAGSSGLVAANRTVADEFEVVQRELAFATPTEGLLRTGGQRLVLAGETTVAPGSDLAFHLRPLDGAGETRTASATVNRSRGFRTVLDLGDGPADGLYGLSVDGARSPLALVAVGDATGARIHADDQQSGGRILHDVRATTTDGGFIVARNESGGRLGHSELLPPGYAFEQLELSTSLRGNRTVTLVAHRDANGNGAFDPGTDPPYRVDGAVVKQSVNITLEGESPATTTASPPSTTTTTGSTTASPTTTTGTRTTATTEPGTATSGDSTTGETTTGGQVGFGLGVAVLAVLVAALAGRSRR